MKLICLFGWFVLLAACAAPVDPSAALSVSAIQTQAAQTVIAALVTPAPAALPTLACDPTPFLDASQETIEKFGDVSERASATSRIALSPVIGEMQTLRRDYKNLVAPVCAEKLQLLVTQAMDAEIESYLSFMRQDSDSTVQSYMETAAKSWEDAVGEMREVQYALGTPRPPVTVTKAPRPAQTRAPATSAFAFRPPPADLDPKQVGTPIANQTMRVCSDNAVEVLARPAFGSGAITYLYKNSQVQVYGRLGDWYFVGMDTSNRPGYVSKVYLC